MSDTLTAPVTPGPSDVPATPAESLATQLYAPTAATPADAAPSTPADEAKPAEAPAEESAPEYIKGDDGQWRRADGTFATAEEIADIEAQLADEEKAQADAEANRAATVAKLRDRNGNLIEVETGDEQLAQLINQNTNDGMRRREFLEAKTTLDAREAIITRAESIIEHNPEGFVQENLTDEQQVRLATLLLARHFDALVPIIQSYDANPTSRIATTAEAQLRIKQQTDEFHAHSSAQQSAASVRRAVAALIPETAEQEAVDRFWADATIDVQRAIASGAQVTPETVAQLLAPRLSLYGFQGAAAPAAPQRPRITLAKSGTTKPAAPAADPMPAGKASQRLRLAERQRNAAAVPPHGRGGLAKPAAPTTDRAFQDAAHLLYGGTPRAS